MSIKLPYKLALYFRSLSQRLTVGVEGQTALLAVGRLASFYGRRFAANVTVSDEPQSRLFLRSTGRDRWLLQRSLPV